MSVCGTVGRERRREQRVLLFSAGLSAACPGVRRDGYGARVAVQRWLCWEAHSARG